jgi:2-oxo-3-hexenedioate decarboxylase
VNRSTETAVPSDATTAKTTQYADELLDALDRNVQLQPITARDPSFDDAAAYAVNHEILRRRVARGEKPIGRKIGFTNRTIWPLYGVYTPMWAPVYDSTVTFFEETEGSLAIGHLSEPRFEPEILLHFKTSPIGAESEAEILACIDWIAHSVEIVQSHYPNWKMKAPDSAAAFGLHGALIVGPPQPIERLGSPGELIARLRTFTLTLSLNGEPRAQGTGANVLDSPLLAFAHLQGLLKDLPQFEPVQAGEIVTTGTLTDAMPIEPGQTWSTALDGLDLPGLRVTFG